MASVIGWLDQSEEQQRKMREVIDLFSDADSRDELGIAVIRDAFSDLLFPGLSTIQTRARYFFFVPWSFLDLEKERVPSVRIEQRSRDMQARLVGALRSGGESTGVIGIEAGDKLKRLPHTVYWNGLIKFGMFVGPKDWGNYVSNLDRFLRRTQTRRGGESVEAQGDAPHNWHRSLPAAPADYLKAVNLHLTVDEAEYLRERMVRTDPHSLLAHLLQVGVGDSTTFPWDASVTAMSPVLRERVAYARFFSEMIWGAALLYNLMLAEEATRRGLQSGSEARVGRFREQLDTWSSILTVRADELQAIDRGQFWKLVQSTAPAGERSRVFVDQWLDLAMATSGDVADYPAARELIADREYKLKRGTARLTNPRQLEMWGGSSGVGRLEFRWPTGRSMVRDVMDGLGRA